MLNYKDFQSKLDGLWADVYLMYGIDVGNFKGLNTKNTTCPLCGGTDRAHWREQNGRIALFCRHCAADSMKSPEDVIMEYANIDFNELVKNLADYCNHVSPEKIHKARVHVAAQPLRTMPIDHKQDHLKVERFVSRCEWAHSMEMLKLNAPNPQELPIKGDVDYWPMQNSKGVAVNLVKYDDYLLSPKFLLGGQSYGCTYKISGGKRKIIVVNPIDGVLCWYKTKATVLIAFTEENLRYCLKHDQSDAVACLRKDDFIAEFTGDFQVRKLVGTPDEGFAIEKVDI